MLRPSLFAVVALLAATPSAPRGTPRNLPPPDLGAAIDSFIGPRIAADSFSGVVLLLEGWKGLPARWRSANRDANTPM